MSEKTIREKFLRLAQVVPSEFRKLGKVNLDAIAKEVGEMPRKERLLLTQFGSLMSQLEALKQIASYDSHSSEMPSLRSGLFFQDLLPLMVFHEFWKDLEIKGEQLAIIAGIMRSERFNKIRNAIAHAEVGFDSSQLILNDRGYKISMNMMEASKLASCLACLATLLAIWAS